MACLLCGLHPGTARAQIGGRHVFEFITLPVSSTQSGLGGYNITHYTGDQAIALANPALLRPSQSSRVSLTFANFMGGVNYGVASYVHDVENIGTFHAGIQYLNYGTMTQADAYGNRTGEFSANDLNFTVGAKRSFGNFHFGTNFKFLFSNVAGYNATGLAVDFGGLYYHPEQDLSVALALRNIGFQISAFAGSDREPLPFDLQIGVAKRIPHTPFRLTLTGVELTRPNLVVEDPNAAPQFDLSGKPIPPPNRTADNIFRHMVFGLEVLIGKKQNIQLRVGYNHRRRQELKPAEQGFGLAGFSLGFGVRISRFFLDYSFNSYSAAGALHQFSVSFLINSFGQSAAPVEEY